MQNISSWTRPYNYPLRRLPKLGQERRYPVEFKKRLTSHVISVMHAMTYSRLARDQVAERALIEYTAKVESNLFLNVLCGVRF